MSRGIIGQVSNAHSKMIHRSTEDWELYLPGLCSVFVGHFVLVTDGGPWPDWAQGGPGPASPGHSRVRQPSAVSNCGI